MRLIKKKHPLYYTWSGMMSRCYVQSNSHCKYYGGKGVMVDERWHDFENFVHDINNILPNGRLLYKKEYQLDKDIKGGKLYSFDSCTVISAEENNRLHHEKQIKKVSAIYEENEIIFNSLVEASTILDIKRSSIISCIRRGNKHKSGYYFKYIS